MGSTLEHGIYLPSEGEKNCYQGLAGNWNKVDGALGDVAELKQSIESKFTKEIVTELPTEDINPFCIYMILKTDPETDNIYDEWVYINNAWEYLGNTKVDMTQYYTKQEVNQLPAVASGVTATKVGNYDAHIANGDIHVTANDKTKWTNSANTHVLRLAKSALTPSSSTNAFSNLDDSTALKVGDKVMDTAGVLFEVTAIDTQNSTFTIGASLIDLAQDSDVVHKSGNETITGIKTFSSIGLTANPCIRMYSPDDEWNVQPATAKQSEIRFTDKNSVTISYFVFQHRPNSTEPFRTCWRQQKMDGTSGYYSIAFGNLGNFYPENDITITLGTQSSRWKSVYANNYYYGLNNVEFSTKFVTTDTAQTIGGVKTFSNDIRISKISPFCNVFSSGYIKGQTPTSNIYSGVRFYDDINSGSTNTITGGFEVEYNRDGYNKSYIASRNYAGANQKSFTVGLRVPNDDIRSIDFLPSVNGIVNLGTSTNKWKSFNGVEPSSLSLPSGNVSDFIDISSYFTNTGSGDRNTYTAPANGWIYLRLGNIGGCQADVFDANNNRMWGQSSTGSVEQLTIPILKGQTLLTQWNTSSTVYVDTAHFIPCQGNV